MKLQILLTTLALVFSVNAEAKTTQVVDSDKAICEEIRDSAADRCADEATSQEFKACYEELIDEDVRFNNDETSDLSGGGNLVCKY